MARTASAPPPDRDSLPVSVPAQLAGSGLKRQDEHSSLRRCRGLLVRWRAAHRPLPSNTLTDKGRAAVAQAEYWFPKTTATRAVCTFVALRRQYPATPCSGAGAPPGAAPEYSLSSCGLVYAECKAPTASKHLPYERAWRSVTAVQDASECDSKLPGAIGREAVRACLPDFEPPPCPEPCCPRLQEGHQSAAAARATSGQEWGSVSTSLHPCIIFLLTWASPIRANKSSGGR